MNLQALRGMFFAFSLLLVASAQAGDCVERPLVIYDVKVLSCEPLTRASASKLAKEQARLEKEPDSFFRGVIIDTEVVRSREVLLSDESAKKKPEGRPWKPVGTQKLFLSREDFSECAGLKKNARVQLAYFTSCECDIWPPTGTCALRATIVRAVPAEHREWAK